MEKLRRAQLVSRITSGALLLARGPSRPVAAPASSRAPSSASAGGPDLGPFLRQGTAEQLLPQQALGSAAARAELEATLGASEPMLAEYIIAKYDTASGALAEFRTVLTSEAGIDEVHVDRLHALIQTLTVRMQALPPTARATYMRLERCVCCVCAASSCTCAIPRPAVRCCRLPSRQRVHLSSPRCACVRTLLCRASPSATRANLRASRPRRY